MLVRNFKLFHITSSNFINNSCSIGQAQEAMVEMWEGVRDTDSLQQVLLDHPGMDQHQRPDAFHDVPRADQDKTNVGHHQSLPQL